MTSPLTSFAASAAVLLLGALLVVAAALLLARSRGWLPGLARGARDESGIRVLDIKWLAGKAGCALLEIGQQRYLVPLGDARTPLALPSPTPTAVAAMEPASNA